MFFFHCMVIEDYKICKIISQVPKDNALSQVSGMYFGYVPIRSDLADYTTTTLVC